MMSDHYIVPLFVSGTILLLMFAFALITYLLVYKNKQNAYQIERANMLHDHEVKILNAHLEEQERVMSHISKELHDNVLQSLTFIKSNYHILAENNLYEEQPKVKLVFDTIGTILFGAINDLRNLSHSLNSQFIAMTGLANVLEKETSYVTIAKNIECTLTILGAYNRFDPDKELLIYRIAQEAIQNAAKYSEATTIVITLTCHPSNFSMCISDNGIGFDASKVEDSPGIGILNMKERAKALNGTLNIWSEPQKGTSLTLTIPA